MLLDGEAEALTRKAVELALAGDPAALRLCLDRTVAPRRERSVELALPPIHSADDILALLETLNTQLGKTIVMVTHDPAAAERAGTIRRLVKGALQ